MLHIKWLLASNKYFIACHILKPKCSILFKCNYKLNTKLKKVNNKHMKLHIAISIKIVQRDISNNSQKKIKYLTKLSVLGEEIPNF